MKYRLACVSCGREYDPAAIRYTCPDCGDRLGTLEVKIDYRSIRVRRKDFDPRGDMTQFEKLLPIVPGGFHAKLKVGGTPLYRFDGLMGFERVLVKYDGGNPTASFKDRASVMAVAKAFEYGFDTIYCASTGNAASSLAGLAVPAGLRAVIFLPATAPAAKLAQIFVFGAEVVAVDGTYDQAFDVSLLIGNERGWYSRNSAINPYLLEGKKTAAMEIAVQNGWEAPDAVLVAVGDGTVASSFYKGFADLRALGLVDRVPMIVGVQAEGACALKRAFDRGEPFLPADATDEEPVRTVADSIAVGKPRDVVKACSWIRKSGGFLMTVSDDEILAAIESLASATGVFAEPAGAAPYAGLKKAAERLSALGVRSVAVAVTGSGLKDIKAVERLVAIRPVAPDAEAVRRRLDEMGL